MRTFTLLFMLGGILLFGCDANDPAEEDIPETIQALEMPVGTTWNYTHRVYLQDTLGVETLVETQRIVVRVEETGAEVGSYADLIRLAITHTSVPETTTDVWLHQTPTMLREIAYRNATGYFVHPKQGGPMTSLSLPFGLSALFSEKLPRLGKAAQDTLIVRDEPRVIYRYPLTDSLQWTSFSRPFLSNRSVVGQETIEVPAGTFPCTVVHTTVPQDLFPGTEFTDYITPKGLIRRIVLTGPGLNVGNQGIVALREILELNEMDN